MTLLVMLQELLGFCFGKVLDILLGEEKLHYDFGRVSLEVKHSAGLFYVCILKGYTKRTLTPAKNKHSLVIVQDFSISKGIYGSRNTNVYLQMEALLKKESQVKRYGSYISARTCGRPAVINKEFDFRKCEELAKDGVDKWLSSNFSMTERRARGF